MYNVCIGHNVLDAPLQIRKLESTLMDHDNKTLWNDYRIAQPLNDRVVESSFLPRLGKGCRSTISNGLSCSHAIHLFSLSLLSHFLFDLFSPYSFLSPRRD